ncbi:MAG: LicD family protein [Ruminococcaceae bacterium]|jgi:lipopolysaccharide cholinephosphotransferase|nr:LicD family protein [Oscillospiraceae bacterium]
MLSRLRKKIRTVFINRVLRKILPTYIAQRRLESYVKKDVGAIVNKQEYLFWLSENREGESLSDTKKRVFAKIPPAEGILRDIQLLALRILCELDAICKENSIDYWVMGGTIIGSVRHKGFIPWDDDVDIGMMRKDYDKLKEVLKNSDKLDVLEFYNFNGLYRIPKVVLKNSETKLAIDIILFDFTDFSDYDIPEDATLEEKYDIVWDVQKVYRQRYVRKLKSLKFQHRDVIKTDLIRNEKRFAKTSAITQKYIDKCKYRYDDGNVVIWGIDNFTSKAPDKRRLYTKESVFPLTELEFEGKFFPAPNDYMDMITREAGDIWSFPGDIGKPKFFSEAQLAEEYAKSKEAMKAVFGKED